MIIPIRNTLEPEMIKMSGTDAAGHCCPMETFISAAITRVKGMAWAFTVTRTGTALVTVATGFSGRNKGGEHFITPTDLNTLVTSSNCRR